jgi:hypothetical protein
MEIRLISPKISSLGRLLNFWEIGKNKANGGKSYE